MNGQQIIEFGCCLSSLQINVELPFFVLHPFLPCLLTFSKQGASLALCAKTFYHHFSFSVLPDVKYAFTFRAK
jgi:hypothetical protein